MEIKSYSLNAKNLSCLFTLADLPLIEHSQRR